MGEYIKIVCVVLRQLVWTIPSDSSEQAKNGSDWLLRVGEVISISILLGQAHINGLILNCHNFNFQANYIYNYIC